MFGKVENPLQKINPSGGYRDVTDLPLFISNLVRLITMGAGIFAVINILIAGITYMGAGDDQQKIANASNSIFMTIIGLAVMVGAFALAGIISYVLYQDAGVILKPVIYGPGKIN